MRMRIVTVSYILVRIVHKACTDSVSTNIDIALFIFFVPYILFEVPSNLILKKLAPSTWLSLIMVLWGKDHRAYVSEYD